jgi:hypothetical protein
MFGIPRGMQLNNPGNVRISSAPWLGKITPSTDPDFEEFDNVLHGIRAAAIIFSNYSVIDGLSTIAQYISRWAPQADSNPTGGYIQFVSQRCGCDSNNQLNVQNAGNLSKLLAAVFEFEQGSTDFVSPDQIAAGVALALPHTAM